MTTYYIFVIMINSIRKGDSKDCNIISTKINKEEKGVDKLLEYLIPVILGIGFGLLFPMWLFGLEFYWLFVIIGIMVLCYVLADKVEKKQQIITEDGE